MDALLALLDDAEIDESFTRIVSAVTASGKINYIDEDEMQKDYLVCTDSMGNNTYVPLDIDYTTKIDEGYTLKLRISEPVILTAGGKTSGGQKNSDEVKADDKKTDEASGFVAPFSDVTTNDYYYDAAIWAYEKGMVDGDEFEGNTPCTRASTVVYLWKNADAPEVQDMAAFEDVDENADYSMAVAWAVETGRFCKL
ncbi:MAG: S-layer homology domain-containing protein [Clostridia bacterium]|nr:S-layer homology domain-containing protein [Clostridia bacterium]